MYFMQQYFKNEKKLVQLQHLVPIDLKLLGPPIINTEQLYHQLLLSSAWQRYLPDKVEESRNFICNLLNTCSGMAFEQVLSDAREKKKEIYCRLRNFEDDLRDMIKDTGANLTPAEQYRNQRCNAKVKRQSLKANGFKLKQAKQAIAQQFSMIDTSSKMKVIELKNTYIDI